MSRFALLVLLKFDPIGALKRDNHRPCPCGAKRLMWHLTKSNAKNACMGTPDVHL
jgi:hypothetical protein